MEQIAASGSDLRSISITRYVQAPPIEVWKAWVAADSLRAWWPCFDARIELRVGGAFEILMLAEAPVGQQGSEGCRVLSYVPGEMFSFTWNAPPHLAVREAHTWVVLSFTPKDEGADVRLVHTGFLEGSDWDEYVDYFERNWPMVLEWLAAYFA